MIQSKKLVRSQKNGFFWALFLFGFPNLKQKIAAEVPRGHAPPRGPRCGGATPGCAPPRGHKGGRAAGVCPIPGRSPVRRSRGLPHPPLPPGVVVRNTSQEAIMPARGGPKADFVIENQLHKGIWSFGSL